MVRPNSTSPVLDHSAVRRVPADLATGQGLDVAMKGVTGVYVIAPNVDDSEVDMVRHVVESAVAQRVPRIAYHSVLHPDDASMPHHLRKARAERLIRDRRPGATVLRPSAYQQNLLGAALSGDLVVPYSLDAVFTNVDLGDVAEVAARVLTEDGHAGATYELAGPERQTTRDLAAIASQVLGHEVYSRRITMGEWVAGPGDALSERERQELGAMFTAYDRDGFAGDPARLRSLLGRPAGRWADILRRSRDGRDANSESTDRCASVVDAAGR